MLKKKYVGFSRLSLFLIENAPQNLLYKERMVVR